MAAVKEVVGTTVSTEDVEAFLEVNAFEVCATKSCSKTKNRCSKMVL